MKTDHSAAVAIAFAAAFSVAKQHAAFAPKLGTTELLYRSAVQMNLQPAWIIPGSLFAATINDQETYLSLAQSPLNSHASVSLAKDKYFTRRILERKGIPNIPFSRPRTHAEAEAFLSVHKTIIAKPVEGLGSYDIHIVTEAAQLRDLQITNYILEKYIVGREMRYLVLDGAVIGVYWSDYGVSVEANRPHQCISYPEAEWDAALVDSSLRVAQALGLAFAAVDYLVDEMGDAHVLEVNATPDLKWFHAPSSGPKVDVTSLFLEAIVRNGQIRPALGYNETGPVLTGEL